MRRDLGVNPLLRAVEQSGELCRGRTGGILEVAVVQLLDLGEREPQRAHLADSANARPGRLKSGRSSGGGCRAFEALARGRPGEALTIGESKRAALFLGRVGQAHEALGKARCRRSRPVCLERGGPALLSEVKSRECVLSGHRLFPIGYGATGRASR